MKTMTSALALTKHIILLVFLMVCFTACLFNGDIPPGEIHVSSLSDAEEKLAAHIDLKFGFSPYSPVTLFVRDMNLGDLSKLDNNYLRLLEIIGNSGLYAELFLAIVKMGGSIKIIGDSAFLGSTPGNFTIISDNKIYYWWCKIENASKFNNNGEDIVFF